MRSIVKAVILPISCVALILLFSTSVYAGFQITKTDDRVKIEVKNPYVNWDGITNVAQFCGPDGGMYYAVDSGDSVVVHKSRGGKPESGIITLEKIHPLFGTAVCDENGYLYLVTGEENETEDTSVETVFISKYDKTGRLIQTIGDNGRSSLASYYPDDSCTKVPFHAGNCDAAVTGEILTVNYARTMHNGHQSNSVFSININNMSKVSVGDIYQSHSFAQRVVSTKEGFVYMCEGDCFDRAFTSYGVKMSGNNASFSRGSNIFDFWVEDGAYERGDMSVVNKNFAHMGGLAALSDGKVAFVAQSAQSLNSRAANESEEIFVQIYDPYADLSKSESYVTSGTRSGLAGKNGRDNVTNYGVKWLTNYGTSKTVSNVQVVSVDGDQIVVLYELKEGTQYKGVYYIVLDKMGNVITPATSLGQDTYLNPCEMPVYADGMVCWVGNKTNDNSIYIYSLSLTPVNSVSGVTVTPQKETVKIGSTVTLTAEVSPSDATIKTVTWNSADKRIATVDNSGTVTGIKAGKVIITATTSDGGYTATCEVTVEEAAPITIPVTGVTVSPKEASVKTGRKVTLTAEVAPSDASVRTVTWSSADEGVATVDSRGKVKGISAGKVLITATTTDGGFTDTCEVTVISSAGSDPEPLSVISKPVADEDEQVTTWDCVWFGEYWQNRDYNGDGKVTEADDKDPIKWRVLDVDDSGKALLLSDSLLDITEYNTDSTDISWNDSSLRSFLNSTGEYESAGFMDNAFSDDEINAIVQSELENSNNPQYKTKGCGTSTDRIFCLSIGDALNEDYGFEKNEFTVGENPPYYTEADATRRAVTTKYMNDKSGYDAFPSGTFDNWWLRSPGADRTIAATVDEDGQVSAHGASVYSNNTCVRPALWIDIDAASSLGKYAGIVSSDGTMEQEGLSVKGVSLVKNLMIAEGESIKLTPEIIPEDADDHSATWKVVEDEEDSGSETVITVDGNGVVTGVSEGKATVEVKTVDGEFTDTCEVTVVPSVKDISSPRTEDGVSTWDCIWFGEYWQNSDTTGDGKVTQADGRDPIKWRVLDIDESGNALLISDTLLDAVEYNEENETTSWKDSSLRKFLNSTDDYEGAGFLDNAFDDAETKVITESEITNPGNVMYGSPGGEDTVDRVFCLSMGEALNPEYGFVMDSFTTGNPYYYTDPDPTREAVVTGYVNNKTGYNTVSVGSPDNWWLRSPGADSLKAATVDQNGQVSAYGASVHIKYVCVRPVLRMNLGAAILYWSKAGTVSSDGEEEQEGQSVRGVSLMERRVLKVGNKITLTPEVMPSDADNTSVSWKSYDESVASVDVNGVVTALKEGSASLEVKTEDGGFTDICIITVVAADDVADPVTDKGVSTWDCIWFGNYWQDKVECRQPVKWRVLDVDESGNALLLSDSLIDIAEYHESRSDTSWELCTLRSFLNGVFIGEAFSKAEIDAIEEAYVKNCDNPFYGTAGGDDTADRLFCLSLDEAVNPEYGFIDGSFSYGKTGTDKTRVSYVTVFTDNKKDYCAGSAGEAGSWWLRSPGSLERNASYVTGTGAVSAGGANVGLNNICVRPAFRLNLLDSSPLWGYAGTVCSDGTVNEVRVSATGVSIEMKYLTLYPGDSYTLEPVISPENATDKNVTWESSDDQRITVDEKGKVTGINKGSATITVRTNDGGHEANCLVIVKERSDPVPVNGIEFPDDQQEVELFVNQTAKLTPAISPDNATNKNITWNSSDDNTAVVYENGVVRGIAEGVAVITVTTADGGYTASCTVRVQRQQDGSDDPGMDVNESDKSITLLPGETRRLIVNKENIFIYGISYASSDPKVVSVKNGMVTAKKLKKGETEKKVIVTASYRGDSVPFEVTVKGTPDVLIGETGKKISATKTVKTEVGTDKKVTVKLPKAFREKEVVPDNTDYGCFTLGEAQPDGAKISFAVTPKKAGADYIVWTVTGDDGNKSQAVTKVIVTEPTEELTVNGGEGEINLNAGEGKRLTVTASKWYTDNKTVTFSVKGKGIQCSKSGYVVATAPDSEAFVTVTLGKLKKIIIVRSSSYTGEDGKYLTINKTSVNVKHPKEGTKPGTAALKLKTPKKAPPEVKWAVSGYPDGVYIDPATGKVYVDSTASPGCYIVTASAEGFNTAYCELVVK